MAELSIERIAQTGLDLVDEEGVSAFTLRAVARRLDVTPMALYHHVADKAELASLVVDTAMNMYPMDEPTGDWKEDLWLYSKWVRTIAKQSPATVHLRRAYQVWTPTTVRLTQIWTEHWHKSGLPADAIEKAALTSAMSVYGMISEEVRMSEMEPSEVFIGKDQYPDLTSALQTEAFSSELFELSVRSIIDGLVARLS